MDKKFQKLKRKIEAKSGPMSLAEEIEAEALLFFARGVQLKNRLESSRKSRVLATIGDFLSRKKRKRKN